MNAAGFVVLVVVLALATGFGLWRRQRDGRLRSASTAATPTAGAPTFGLAGEPLGERATLVQFSTAFCQPCRATRRILTEVSELLDGVRYVDIDAEQHLELVRQLAVRRTPTVFVLDADGTVVQRATGQPRKADVVAALGALLP